MYSVSLGGIIYIEGKGRKRKKIHYFILKKSSKNSWQTNKPMLYYIYSKGDETNV